MPSRKIEDLQPDVAVMCREHIHLCQSRGIIIVVYQTLRTLEEQAMYFAQGRTLDLLPKEVTSLIQPTIEKWRSNGLKRGPGPRVTNALPNVNAPHIRGIAYDCAPSRFGRLAWSDVDLPVGSRGKTDWKALWLVIGEMGESAGLEWGGRWKSRPDSPHFQRRSSDV